MVKNPPASIEDLASIPGSGRVPGGGNGSPLQYSCLRSLVGYSLWGHEESDTTEQLNRCSAVNTLQTSRAVSGRTQDLIHKEKPVVLIY